MFQNLNLSKLDNATVQRIGDVLMSATQNGDYGVIDWATRAIADASFVGQLRSRDAATLDRLERTYHNDFYRSRNEGANARLQAA